jgi:CRISPR-associated protein Cas5 subtype I-C
MGYGFCVRIRGDRALFTRPEAKAERVSYPVITPSAARGILDAVFWHPGMRYVIDRITVLAPIRYDSVRRNEVGAVAHLGNIRAAGSSGGPYHLNVTENRQQRAAVILRQADYLVDAHFDILPETLGEQDDAEKFYNILLRRLRRGQNFRQPCLGCREFPARVELVECDRPVSCYAQLAEMDLGYMLYDLRYEETECTPQFFHAVMRSGVITPEAPQ